MTTERGEREGQISEQRRDQERAPTPKLEGVERLSPKTFCSIRVKLAVFVTVIVVVVATGVGLSAFLLAQSSLSEQIKARLEDVAWSRTALIRTHLDQLETEIEMALRSPLVQKAIVAGQDPGASLQRELADVLQAVKRSSPMIRSAAVATAEGRIVASTRPDAVGSLFEGPMPDLRVGESRLGLPRRDASDMYRSLFAARIDSKDGVFLGFFLADINVSGIHALVSRRLRTWNSATVLLGVRRGGEFRALFADETGRELSRAETEAFSRALRGERGSAVIRARGGLHVLASYAPVDDRQGHPIESRWALVATVDRDEAYGPIRHMRTVTIVVAGLLGVTLLLAAYVLSRRLTAPITRLSHSAMEVASDPFVPLYQPGNRKDEIGVLARSIGHMREELVAGREWLEQRAEERTRELRESNARLEREITERAALAEELRVAKDEAEASSRAKSSFLAAMSHEMRTPLNGIVGMADLLATTPLENTQREYLSMIQESGETLSQVIDDVLDFSRMQAGRIEIEARPFNLRDVLDSVLRSFSIRAHKKHLELALQMTPDMPEWVEGDPWRLRQVLTNLVGNAVKFTDAGEVVVSVEAEWTGPADVTLSFYVRDTGIGIAEERQQAIFAPFEQGDISSTRRFGGAGLGLTIASRLVERMGGTMGVESRPWCGSTFHFTIPTKVVARGDEEKDRGTIAALAGMRVLVVDDSAINLKIMSEMLAHWGTHPTTSSDPQEVVEVLREAHRGGEGFQLVILDAVMPELDGFALARRIRGEADVGAPIIMMLSSLDRPGDVRRCKEIGVASYLLKPIRQSDLRDAILGAFGLSPQRKAEENVSPIGTAHSSPMTILVAEDNPVSQKLVRGLLDHWGHRSVIVEDGLQALAALRTREQRSGFDVVLMDVQMSGLDGLAATRSVRALEREQGGHVPIIAMTAHAMKGDRERCLAAGMDGYLAKPVRARALQRAVLPYSRQTEADAEAARAAGANAIDWARARKGVDSNEDILAAMVAAFLQDLPHSLAEIESAAAAGDATRLRRAAHSLKGAAQSLAAEPLSEVALELERAGQRNQVSDLEEPLSRLRQEAEHVRDALQSYQPSEVPADREFFPSGTG